MRTAARAGLALGALALAAAAAAVWRDATPTPRETLTRAVAESAGCATADDCVALPTECPLGCYHAVSRGDRDEVARLAARLLEEARRDGDVCAYDCLPPRPLACVAGRCVFLDR